MFVPSYVPQPIVISDNVSLEPYMVRLGFIRRVLTVFLGSLMMIGGISKVPVDLPAESTAAASIAILLGMVLVRRAARGRWMEVVISTGMLLVFLVSAGLLARAISQSGIALWPPLVSVALAWLYAISCGRDLSFITLFFLPLITSSIVWGVAIASGFCPGWSFSASILANVLVLFYVVYDLSMLLRRRRLGEEMGAVADLYRDMFNFTTYYFRVKAHWKRYPLFPRP